MTSIRYRHGDVTSHDVVGPTVLAHCCNDVGAFGAGVSGAISRKWPRVEEKYREWHRNREWKGFGLGRVQYVLVDELFWVANLVGQQGLRKKGKPPPIRYEAIDEGLESLSEFCVRRQAEVIMPKLGAGLAGGEWSRIEESISKILLADDIKVTVYLLDEGA